MLERGFAAIGEVGNSETSIVEGSETCKLKIMKSKMQANKISNCSKNEKKHVRTSVNNAEFQINNIDSLYCRHIDSTCQRYCQFIQQAYAT